MLPIILYPCEYGNIYKIDECYEFEREVAKELGFVTYLFNYDDFVNGCELKINTGLENNICLNTVVYRGWMLKIEDYKRLYEELLPLSLVLINNPKQYENTHHFINSYPILELYTPKTLFFKKGELIDWNLVRNTFQNKFIVKDYVKSVKGFAFPEYLECSMSNEELDDYIKKFIELFLEQFDDEVTIEVNQDTRFREIEGWTSLVALMVITMIDEEYGITITGDDMRSTSTIGELYNLVASRQ
jgi:acyl carrier protein